MTLKILGALFVIFACGGFGFSIAAAHKREVRTMRRFIFALDLMTWELQYRLTPLPDLCRYVSQSGTGPVEQLFTTLATELEGQVSPDVAVCVHSALDKLKNLPKLTVEGFLQLGESLGKFNVDGQLQGIASVRNECYQKLSAFTDNQDVRLRSYQTLGLCAGAALAIIFI